MSKKSLPTRGWGPWREDWYSICSAHQFGGPDSDCSLCRAGYWRNRWLGFLGHCVYKVCPRLWRWWVNMPIRREQKKREQQVVIRISREMAELEADANIMAVGNGRYTREVAERAAQRHRNNPLCGSQGIDQDGHCKRCGLVPDGDAECPPGFLVSSTKE